MHLRETGQLDEVGGFSTAQTWSTRFAGAKADNRMDWYQNMIKSVLVDGVIDASERKLLRNVQLLVMPTNCRECLEQVGY